MAFVVVALMIVLFLMAVGFSRLGLSDPQQALGLPEGSIRAMIALFLIMVFITFGLYLYRTAAGFSLYTLPCLTGSQVDAYGKQIISKYQDEACKGSNSPYYDITISLLPDQAGVDLAKQLMTTIGTLVVAISSFYFGSRAVQVSRGTTKPDQPKISSVDPNNINRQDPRLKDKDGLPLTIIGEGFLTAEKVKLVQAKNRMEKIADEITSNDSKIEATFRFSDAELDNAFGGQQDQDAEFNLIVINKDGRQDEKPGAFTITAPSTPQPAKKKP
jgi:hypothetical protein